MQAGPLGAELAAWLSLTQGCGRAEARRRLRQAGSVEAAAAGLPASAEQLAQLLRWLDGGDDRSLLRLGDPDYPEALLNSPDPPLLLYLQGRREQLGREALAVVGSRAASPWGMELAQAFAAELAGGGWIVVSGLARGIDGAAHRGALSRGATWAVLGSGLDQVYPKAHLALAAQIAERGLLLSEHPPGTPPLAGHFPVRNRLIAGLSRGCLVVEAALASGSLITARLAAEAGREVFALPGSLRSPLSAGCHQLIQQGAKLTQSVQDILDELRPGSRAQPPAPGAPADEPLLIALGAEACGLDTLQARLGWPTARLQAALLELELAGRLRRLPGERFERCGP